MSRPATRAFLATVSRISALGPHFARLTFTGPDVADLTLLGPDQRIKLLIPFEGGRTTDFGMFAEPRPPMTEWYARWRTLPDAERNPMRTYTLRAVRPELAEVDIDFVLHGTEGPASAWAVNAAIGDALTIIGPDRRTEVQGTGGVEWHPGAATRVLLAGDETAAPAICAIIEGLDPSMTGTALIEVPTAADILPIANRSALEVRWLVREDGAVGSVLDPAVREWGRARAGRPDESVDDPDVDAVLWDVPAEAAGEEYAWLAGEAGVITGLRRHLVRDLGIDRRSVAFMGYWRSGRSEGA